MAPKRHHRTASRGSAAKTPVREKREAAQQALRTTKTTTPRDERLQVNALTGSSSRKPNFQVRYGNRDAIAIVHKQKNLPGGNGGAAAPPREKVSGTTKQMQRKSSQVRHNLAPKTTTTAQDIERSLAQDVERSLVIDEKVQEERQTRYLTNSSWKGEDKDRRTARVIAKPVHKREKADSASKSSIRLFQRLNFKRFTSKRSNNQSDTDRSSDSSVTHKEATARKKGQRKASVTNEYSIEDMPRKVGNLEEDDGTLDWAWTLCGYHPIPTQVKDYGTDAESHVSSITGFTFDHKAWLTQTLALWYYQFSTSITSDKSIVEEPCLLPKEKATNKTPSAQEVQKETKEENHRPSAKDDVTSEKEEQKHPEDVTEINHTEKGEEGIAPRVSCVSNLKRLENSHDETLFHESKCPTRPSPSILKSSESSNDIVTDFGTETSGNTQHVLHAQSTTNESNKINEDRNGKEENFHQSKIGITADKKNDKDDIKTGHIRGNAEETRPMSELFRSCFKNYKRVDEKPSRKTQVNADACPDASVKQITSATSQPETEPHGLNETKLDVGDMKNTITGMRPKRHFSLPNSSPSQNCVLEKSKSDMNEKDMDEKEESIFHPHSSLPPSSDFEINSEFTVSKAAPSSTLDVVGLDSNSINEEGVEMEVEGQGNSFDQKLIKEKEEKNDGELDQSVLDTRSVKEELKGNGENESNPGDSYSKAEEIEEKDDVSCHDMLESCSKKAEVEEYDEDDVFGDDSASCMDTYYSPSLPDNNNLRSFSFSSFGAPSVTSYTTGMVSAVSITSLFSLWGCTAFTKPRPSLKE